MLKVAYTVKYYRCKIYIKMEISSKSEYICREYVNVEVWESYEKNWKYHKFFFYVTKVINELPEHARWKFIGRFKNFKSPLMLAKLVQRILIKSRENIQRSPYWDSAENITSTIKQVIYQCFKTFRQENYKAKTEANWTKHSNIEIPLNVRVGLYTR